MIENFGLSTPVTLLLVAIATALPPESIDKIQNMAGFDKAYAEVQVQAESMIRTGDFSALEEYGFDVEEFEAYKKELGVPDLALPPEGLEET